MAEGFKIADGFIEVHAEVNKDSTTKAAHRVANDIDDVGRRVLGKKKGFGEGIGKSLLGSLGEIVGIGVKLGSSLAESMTSSLAKTIPMLAPIAGPALLVLAPIVAAVGITLGATLAGSIVAGVTTGVIGAGIALAIRDPKVKTAIDSLGNELLSGFTSAAESFIGPTKNAINSIRVAFAEILPDIKGIFASAAKYVQPLVNGFIGLIKNVLPGIKNMVDSAKPVFDVISTMLPRIGTAISEALTDISDNSENAAQGVKFLLQIVETGIQGFGKLIGFLVDIFDNLLDVAMVGATIGRLWEWLPVVGGHIKDNRIKLEGLRNTTDGFGNTSESTSNKVLILSDAFAAAAAEAHILNTAIKGLNDVAISASEAESNFQAAIDNAAAAIKGKVREIDLGTDIGRTYNKHLIELANTSTASAQAIFNETNSQAEANKKFNEGRQVLINQAIAYGLSREKANDYANSIMRIPKSWETTLNADTAAAIKRLGEVQHELAMLKNKTITVTISERLIKAGDYTGQATGHAHGGLIQGPGTGTSDSIPTMLSNGEYVIKASAANKLGVAALDAINSGKMPTTSSTATTKSGMGAMVQNLNVYIQGVWDLSKPFPREAAYKVNEAITNLSRGYA